MPETFKKKVLGVPLYLFVPSVILIIIATMLGALADNAIGALAFLMVTSTVVGIVGKKLPIWNKYLGGGAMLTFLAGSVLLTYNLLPKSTFTTVSTFLNKDGFLDFFIAVLIGGSVLSLDRKQILKSFGGFMPAIAGGVIVAFAFAMLAAVLVGMKPVSALINLGCPIMGDGNGGGCVPMSSIWAQAYKKDSKAWYTSAFAISTIADTLCIVLSALVSRFGEKHPQFSGNGKLLRTKNETVEETKKVKVGIPEVIGGFTLVVVLYELAKFYATKISFVNRAKIGFSIHPFAFMVIFAIILNLTNIIPEELKAGTAKFQKITSKYFLFPLMFAIGMGTNLSSIVKVFTFGNVIVIVFTVIGALVGATLVGWLFGLYPIEAGITAGLCMAGQGGSGDILILSAANRMELMSYAQITSRIGGSVILIIFSMLLGH